MAVTVAWLAGCGHDYVYVPTEQVGAQLEGYPAARYPIPPEAPKGTVYVTSFGVVQTQPAANAPKTALLLVRMMVSNDGGSGPWTLDTRDQLLELPGEGASRPAYVNSDQTGAPVIAVPPGDKRTLDLYYPLPAGMQSAQAIADFDVLWRVQMNDGRPVAQRTPFERHQIEYEEPGPAPAGLYADLAWGPYWWYDPFYPHFTFYHPVIVRERYPVVISPRYAHRPPYVAPHPHHR